MKKSINKSFIAIIVALFMANQLQSQGLYVNVTGGYALATAPGNPFVDQSSTTSGNNTTTTYSTEKATGSFGRGIQAGASVGYMFGEHLGAEIGFGYLIGAKLKYTSSTSNSGFFSNSTSTEGKESARMIRIIPGVRMVCGKGKLKPYLKMGFVVGIAPKIISTISTNSTYVGLITTTTDQKIETTGGTSFGFAAGLGATYTLTKRISIVAEFGVITQSWSPKKSVVTSYSTNGVDQLSSMSNYNKETDYSASYSTTSSTTDTSQPRQQAKYEVPFSSMGINIGVHFLFGKTKSAASIN